MCLLRSILFKPYHNSLTSDIDIGLVPVALQMNRRENKYVPVVDAIIMQWRDMVVVVVVVVVVVELGRNMVVAEDAKIFTGPDARSRGTEAACYANTTAHCSAPAITNAVRSSQPMRH